MENVAVQKHDMTDVTDVTLDAVETNGDVSGFVRLSGSLTPAEDATVTYYDQDGKEVDSAVVSSTGSYSLTDLEEGSYEVVVRHANAETFTTMQTVSAGDDLTSVNYNLTKGGNSSLKVTVMDSEGNKVDVKKMGLILLMPMQIWKQ